MQSARVLGLAQQMANRLTAEAQAEADEMFSDARLGAEQLLGQTQAKADRLVTEAITQAKTMLDHARASAETLERQSRNQAAAQQHQAARQHTEIITTVTEEKMPWKTGSGNCAPSSVPTAPTWSAMCSHSCAN
jgi:cell division septum initiation protein DivIVA